MLPGFEIRRVQADELCILNAFVEEIFHIHDVHKSIPDVQEMLKNQLEKNKEHYSHFSADTKNIMVEFQTIKKNLKILWFDKFIFECPVHFDLIGFLLI